MTADDIAIRPFGDDDSVEELTELLRSAYAELAARGLRYVATWQDAEVTRRRLEGAHCFVAVEDGALVGSITLRPPGARTKCAYYERPGVAVFGQFGVLPTHRGLGIGRRLLDVVDAAARALGATELALDTAAPATHLIDLYRRWGFREVARMDWDTTSYESLVMTRPLSQHRV